MDRPKALISIITKVNHRFGRSSSRPSWRSCSTAAAVDEDRHHLVVKVISQSIIKPSSPTPPHRRHFKLSFLDRTIPPDYYTTFLFFYPTPPTGAAKPHAVLRDSLSKTLSHFYPLAGRIQVFTAEPAGSPPVPSSFVDCNDQGVVYLEAEANQTLIQFLGDTTPPSSQLLTQYLAPPRPRVSSDNVVLPMAAVKTTVFQCGGVAIGASLSHLIADAHTFGMVLKKWAAEAAGLFQSTTTTTTNHVYPDDVAASLFKADEALLSSTLSLLRKNIRSSSDHDDGNIVETQRFVFTGEAIEALKAETRSKQVPNPSRTVAISGLIWKSAIDARRATKDSSLCKTTTSAVSVALSMVNFRSRMKAPLRDYSFSIGNIHWINAAMTDTSTDQYPISHLANLVKGSIDKVDGKLVEKLTRGVEAHHQFHKLLLQRTSTSSSMSRYKFSSILRIGLNEVDFGWGKPLWVTILGFTADQLPIKNLVVLMEATAHAGNDDVGAVEALVSLDEQEMAIFQQDPHLLQYAKVNPRIMLCDQYICRL